MAVTFAYLWLKMALDYPNKWASAVAQGYLKEVQLTSAVYKIQAAEVSFSLQGGCLRDR